jgi:hypothetical protein
MRNQGAMIKRASKNKVSRRSPHRSQVLELSDTKYEIRMSSNRF